MRMEWHVVARGAEVTKVGVNLTQKANEQT